MKKHFHKLFPAYHRMREHESLKFFGALIHDPNLWHMNRRSVAGAFAVGLFCAFLPPLVPQMIVAAAIAIFARVNLPISVMLVWITNPLTWGPIYFFAYKLGVKILGLTSQVPSFHATLEWFMEEVMFIWKPLLVGGLVMGVVSAIAGYFAIRLLWRLHLIRRYRLRRHSRQNRTDDHIV